MQDIFLLIPLVLGCCYINPQQIHVNNNTEFYDRAQMKNAASASKPTILGEQSLRVEELNMLP